MSATVMTDPVTVDEQTHAVDPARLESGQWCHRANKTIGQGDISASYSADRIGMGQPVRKPFSWQGGLWLCVGMAHLNGLSTAECYRLVHPQAFSGKPVSYGEKTADGDSARSDPHGFYHGMSVKHNGTMFVLCGPPATFVPGQSEQLALF